ncbi:MAG TPA: RDD family protein [Arenimonas sp.]|uniref:RDD family protein n=1 Tax=Arenimonas sp. TaxID=1872635 RepID=UPI002B6ACFD5|nr:RDD family protein [Arenimonas sp.]HMB57839.1 RDD family protein [Arenimonas sp.]
MNESTEPSARLTAHPAALGWRLLALTYDCLPMIPLTMLTSAAFLWLHGGRTVETDPLFAALEIGAIWSLVGAYFVLSWQRGGQTMGMRPWRLKVLAADGKPAGAKALWLRYLVACLTPGLCLLWTLIDRERRGLHDLAAGTAFVRLDASTKN